MEKGIPEDVKKQIEAEHDKKIKTFKHGGATAPITYAAFWKEGAEFGYQLSQSKIDELQKEVERLKGLIQQSYYAGRREIHYGTQKAKWQQFKTENNL